MESLLGLFFKGATSEKDQKFKASVSNLGMWLSIPVMDFIMVHQYGVDLSMFCNVGLLNASFKWQMISSAGNPPGDYCDCIQTWLQNLNLYF